MTTLDLFTASRPHHLDPTAPEGGRVEPLPADPWIASSLLHKALRRGEVHTAQRAALTLYGYRGRAIWRRLMVIVAEDVGAGSPEAFVTAVRVCTDPAMRAEMGGDARAVLWLAQHLAETPKDRSPDYLISVANDHPDLEEVRAQCAGVSLPERFDLVADASLSLPARATAAWYASGVNGGGPKRVGRGDLPGLMETYRSLGVPKELTAATQIAATKTGEPICIMVPLVWLEAFKSPPAAMNLPVPVSPTINGVPLYALDQHTQLGKQAIGRFVRENHAVQAFLEECVPEFRHRDAGYIAAFYADATPLARRLAWNGSQEIEAFGTEGDVLRRGIAREVAVPLLDIVRTHLDHLNAIRARLFTRTRKI